MIDDTHSPDLRSWIASANDPASDFPVQNLPLGIVRAGDGGGHPAVAIGQQALLLDAALERGLLEGRAAEAVEACHNGTLNGLMALGRDSRQALRRALVEVLRGDSVVGRAAQAAADALLVRRDEVTALLPAVIGDYTDFYASVHHATNVGSMFRPENPLLPNYKFVPIGYHGRASSIVASGSPVRRPHGQTRADGAAAPTFGPSRRVDYELEVGVFLGPGNPLGEPIPLVEAEAHMVGLCLVNDWSARDIQAWEYQPLGPFLAKNFATTISPWIVTLEALAPFRAPASARDPGDPPPLDYLSDATNARSGGIDVALEVWLQSAAMRRANLAPVRLSRGRLTDLYWTLAQMVAHHASNGCNLRPGDLIASGTVSGPSKESRGCLLELAWRGTEPVLLPTGEERRFLDDGDEVIFRGYCERPGYARIGFGECRGRIAPAGDDSSSS